jgi:hypothetical protein
LGGLVATGAVLFVPVLMRRAPGRRRKAWLVDLVDGIDGARRSLLRPGWRLIGALGYLGLDIAALGATFAASGHPPACRPIGARVSDRVPCDPDPNPRVASPCSKGASPAR